MSGEALFPYRALEKQGVSACPVCENARQRPWPIAHDRYGFPITIHHCDRCGLSYLGEILTRAGYAHLYETDVYRQLVWSATYPGQPFDRARMDAQIRKSQAHYGQSLSTFVAGAIDAGGTVLDAGGSLGRTATALGIAPASVTVLEPSAHERAHAPATVTTRAGWLEDPIDGHYDVALCLQTMDHVTRPLDALRHLRAACPTGWLLADVTVRTVPKIDHPLYWTPTAWHRALSETGWRVHRVAETLTIAAARAVPSHYVTLCH